MEHINFRDILNSIRKNQIKEIANHIAMYGEIDFGDSGPYVAGYLYDECEYSEDIRITNIRYFNKSVKIYGMVNGYETNFEVMCLPCESLETIIEEIQ